MRWGNHKIVRVYAKHEPYQDGHLGEVLMEMRRLGPPRIEVVEWRGDLFAVEGSHRLACAHEIGLLPELVVCELDFTGPEEELFWEETRKRLPHYSWLLSVE